MEGEHIWVRRSGYSHHGIDCGDGTVIHFTGEPGRSKAQACIARTPLGVFLAGGDRRVVSYGRRLSPEEAVANAQSRLGESSYNLVWNNCEHFASWCCTGDARSDQVRQVGATTAGSALAAGSAVGGVSVASGVGAAAGLSGAGVMSGLASAGAIVGGGAAMGPAVLAAAPAVVGAGIVHLALRDDPRYDGDERRARRDARVGSKVATTVAVTATPLVVASTGGVAGLSAVGITTGLATIGGVVGGGIAAGVGVLVAAPVLVAGAAGAGIYFTSRSIRRRRRRSRGGETTVDG